MAKKLSLQDVIALSNAYHNNRYDYSSSVYINRRTDMEVYCPSHKVYFSVNPRNHYEHGVRCVQCFNEDKYQIHIENAGSTHSFKYDYSLVPITVRARDSVDIKCPVHGVFNQNFGNHLSGQGCPSCGSLFWGWSNEKFDKKCLEQNNGIGVFYILKCFNQIETFYKLGITSKSIYSRYRSNGSLINPLMPYKFEVVQEITATSSLVWQLENSLKNYILKSNMHYKPAKYFPGSLTECFLVGG